MSKENEPTGSLQGYEGNAAAQKLMEAAWELRKEADRLEEMAKRMGDLALSSVALKEQPSSPTEPTHSSEAKKAGVPGLYKSEHATNPEIREKFETNLAIYRKIFKGAGITMPTPEEMAAGGINWQRLAALQEAYPKHDLVVAPLTMEIGQLRTMVASVTKDESIPNNPLGRVQGDNKIWSHGLFISDLVINFWDEIMANTKSAWRLPTCQGGSNEQGNPLTWTAFLILGEDELENLDISHVQILPPITGYVAYQMNRICQGKLPVDIKTHTLTEGVFIVSNLFRNSIGKWSWSGELCIKDWSLFYYKNRVRSSVG